jgi:hypothetical protein
MKTPLFGKFDGNDTDVHMLGPIEAIEAPMRRYAPGAEVDSASSASKRGRSGTPSAIG